MSNGNRAGSVHSSRTGRRGSGALGVSPSLTVRSLELLKQPLQFQLLVRSPQDDLGPFPMQAGVSAGVLGSSPVPEHVPYLWKSLTLLARPIRTRWWMTCLRVREAGFRCSRMVSTTSCPVWRRDGQYGGLGGLRLPPSVSRDLKASHLPHPYGRGIDPEAGPLPQGSTQQLCGWKT